MKVNLVSRKIIKPCKPTPSDLKTYKISLMDELNPSMHVIRILYYQSSSTIKEKIINLEESLAQILTLFYPLAGRYNKEKHQVDCNDEGAEFSVAEVDCQLDEITGSGVDSGQQLNHLLPLDVAAVDEPTDPMLGFQINMFQCGGLAIGVCASHRIFDSCSLGIFLTAWAKATLDGGLIHPDFESSSLFPPENLTPLNFGVSRTWDTDIVAKRFVFNKNSIARLRESMSARWSSEPRPPSRVMVVSAVLTQALVRADKAKHGKSRNWIVGQAINVRERTIPPVPKYACGSWVSMSYVGFTADEMDKNYQEIVVKMRQATIQAVKDCVRIFSDKQFGRYVLVDSYFDVAEKAYCNLDDKLVWITDWSKFGEYELDFGFGKPIWVSLTNVPFGDVFILMNTRKNDGIEAWVYLHESDMEYFEKDEQLRMLTAN